MQTSFSRTRLRFFIISSHFTKLFKMQSTQLLKNLYAKNVFNATLKNHIRNISVSGARSSSFKVQDDKEFLEKVQNSKEPVVVDFFATWCGPCRALTPRLENCIAKRNGKVNLAKVDIDDLGELAAKYEVSTIPALVVFRNGKATERLVGLQDEDKLDKWIEKAISDKK